VDQPLRGHCSKLHHSSWE